MVLQERQAVSENEMPSTQCFIYPKPRSWLRGPHSTYEEDSDSKKKLKLPPPPYRGDPLQYHLQTSKEKTGFSHLYTGTESFRPHGPSFSKPGPLPSTPPPPLTSSPTSPGSCILGDGLGKPQEERSGGRRLGSRSHRLPHSGHQRRRAWALRLPPPAPSPSAPVRAQPAALHAGTASLFIPETSAPSMHKPPGRSALWDLESSSAPSTVFATEYRDPAGLSKRKALSTVVNCRLNLHPGPFPGLGGVVNGEA